MPYVAVPKSIVAVLLVLVPVTVRADVIAVDKNGTVAIRTGEGAVHWSISQPFPRTNVAETVDADLVFPPEALTVLAGSTAPSIYSSAVEQVAAAADISPALLEALVWQESRWRPQAVSRAGAIGLTQLMPATARSLGVNPRDPVANLTGGARYLRHQLDLFDGDIERALAAYNAGPARVLRAGGIPAIAETRAYVAAIVRRLSKIPPSTSGDAQ